MLISFSFSPLGQDTQDCRLFFFIKKKELNNTLTFLKRKDKKKKLLSSCRLNSQPMWYRTCLWNDFRQGWTGHREYRECSWWAAALWAFFLSPVRPWISPMQKLQFKTLYKDWVCAVALACIQTPHKEQRGVSQTVRLGLCNPHHYRLSWDCGQRTLARLGLGPS